MPVPGIEPQTLGSQVQCFPLHHRRLPQAFLKATLLRNSPGNPLSALVVLSFRFAYITLCVAVTTIPGAINDAPPKNVAKSRPFGVFSYKTQAWGHSPNWVASFPSIWLLIRRRPLPSILCWPHLGTYCAFVPQVLDGTLLDLLSWGAS